MYFLNNLKFYFFFKKQRELLTKDPAERLGAGVDGYSRLRAHAMFSTLEWSTMEVYLLYFILFFTMFRYDRN